MEIALPLLANIALLALAALVYMVIPRIEDGWSSLARSAAIGLGLGGVAAIVMLIPVTLIPGLIFDTRSAPILMSGILGGPVAAFVAAAPPILMRLGISGIGMEAGVAGLFVAAMSSVIAWYVLKRGLVPQSFLVLPVYAAAATIVGLPSVFLLPDTDLAWALLPKIGAILVPTNVAGTAIIGLLIYLERRRRDMVETLQRSEAAAQEALEVRNRFIAMMSHEVRTPLNAVLGYAQLLRDDTLSEKQAERVSRLSDSAKSLLHLIDDILQFSRLQSESLSVEADRWPLATLLHEAVGQVRQDAARKGLEIRLDPDTVPDQVIEIDGPRLRQVLANVLSNAVKFTERGHVAVSVTVDPSGSADTPEAGAILRISVSDTGIGIPEDQLERIYQPFERLGTTAVPGTGLGMAIVRAVIDAMGGTLGVTSARGSGTTVTLTVPALLHGPVTERRAPEPAAETATAYAPAHETARVLVVDDIDLNADIACAFLAQVGCTTAIATNGAEAVDTVRKERFDAVLMDVEMPVMDGLAATRAIRDAATPDDVRKTPIIALTAYASRADMQACLEAGMNGYLSKPVEKEVLFAALARHGVLRAVGTPPPRPADDAPVFCQDRYSALEKLVPAAVLRQVLSEATTQIESLGAQVSATAVGPEDKRQALHKLVSIAGNIGLLHLSTLSRHHHTTLKDGGGLGSDDVTAFASAVDQALIKIGELRSQAPTPT